MVNERLFVGMARLRPFFPRAAAAFPPTPAGRRIFCPPTVAFPRGSRDGRAIGSGAVGEAAIGALSKNLEKTGGSPKKSLTTVILTGKITVADRLSRIRRHDYLSIGFVKRPLFGNSSGSWERR